MMRLFSFTAAALFVQGIDANSVLRFGCSQITVERLDPLVNPGAAPSPHVHQIIGGNAFAPTMPYEDISKLANCTTCTFPEDRSNYWTANLYFKARNGTYKRVGQVPNRFLNGEVGGMTVYYTSAYDNTKVTAFKPGFRMLAGDPMQRVKAGITKWNGICFRCYNAKNFGGDDRAPCSDSRVDTVELPNKACPGGIRTTVRFPTCWDGKNLDSPDHSSHVSYPQTGTFETSGRCSSTHPIKLPQLMFEVIWDTAPFNDPAIWPANGEQPFHLSVGDNVGYSQHGDYVFGWEGDSLQRAMDANCFGATCTALKTQTFAQANQCKIGKTVTEDVEGWLTTIPGL